MHEDSAGRYEIRFFVELLIGTGVCFEGAVYG